MPRHLVYRAGGRTAVLTTEHAASSYGIPVLVVAGAAYGPGDSLPSGCLAAELVRRFLNGGNAGRGHWGPRNESSLAAARAFLAAEPAAAVRSGA